MDDVIQYQRLASGYVPGLSEHGVPAASAPPALGLSFGQAVASSALLENCLVVRPVAAGIFDIIIGGSGPAPVGIGGTSEPSPPLVAPAGTVPGVNRTGRVSVNPRTIMAALGAAPATAAGSPDVSVAIYYGSELGAVPLYTGIDNNRVVRVIFTTNLGQAAGVYILADCDFDFSVERVLDPSTEP